MQISPINRLNYCYKPIPPKNPINFCRWENRCRGEKIDPSSIESWAVLNATKDKVLNRHISFFFRDDIDWSGFGKYLKDKFSNTSKVNSYIWGCSEGQEAYSFSMLLTNVFKDEKSKFLPIRAMDIVPSMIIENNLKKDKGYQVSESVFFKIKQALDIKNDEVWELIDVFMPHCRQTNIKKAVTDGIEFSCSNIATDLDKIDSENPSIVMCRNMWPYINVKKYDECAQNLYNNLKKGSIVVLGNFDIEGEPYLKGSNSFKDSLIKFGFKPVDLVKKGYSKHQDSDKPILIYEK